jgi:DNA polymerase-3 subunit delta
MKNPKSNIFLFFGEDTYSSSQKLKFWQEEFTKKYGADALEIINGKTLDPAQFSTNIETMPFLSEKRFMIVKDFIQEQDEEAHEKVAKNLDNANELCIIVFYENENPKKTNTLFKKIAKIGQIEEFPRPFPADITKWILNKAKQDNINISPREAGYLEQYCEPNLWTISNELEKLKVYANGEQITKEMIEELCTPSLTSSIFKLTDAVAQKNVKDSLKTFAILKDSGEDLMGIFFMIARHFRILIQVKEMLEKRENQPSIIRRLKQHPFVIQKTSLQSRNFTQKKLEEIHEKLLTIDIKTKTGKIKSYRGNNKEFELEVEKLIIDCCK